MLQKEWKQRNKQTMFQEKQSKQKNKETTLQV